MASTLLASPQRGVHDRCDRCGAQAYFRAVLIAGDLLFCAHHGRQYSAKLSETAVLLEDNSAAIHARLSPAAF